MPKKSNRVKSGNTRKFIVANWVAAQENVRRIGDLQCHIRIAEAEAKVKLDKITAALQRDTAPAHDEISRRVEGIEAFAKPYLKTSKKTRSRKTPYGVFGWRKSPPAISLSTKHTLGLLTEVLKKKAKQFINVKETPDKKAMLKLTDEELAAVKARRVLKDEFFVEPTIPEAVDNSGSK